MLLITGVKDEKAGKDRSITHSTERGSGPSAKTTHVIRVYEPVPTAGDFAGRLLVQLRLSEADAKELKAHL